MEGRSAASSTVLVTKIQSDEDLQKAFAIREEVFMKEQQVSREDEYDGFDAESHHYLGSVNGEPAGTARWRRTGEGIKLERFCVLPGFRRRGLANELVRVVMKDILALMAPNEKVYLHAQVDVIALYESAGFKKVGNEFLECNIRHQTMEYSGNTFQ